MEFARIGGTEGVVLDAWMDVVVEVQLALDEVEDGEELNLDDGGDCDVVGGRKRGRLGGCLRRTGGSAGGFRHADCHPLRS